MKLIVIHGIGGTFIDACESLQKMADMKALWRDGAFFVEPDLGMVARKILREPKPDRYMKAFQKLVISRLLFACSQKWDIDTEKATRISEFVLNKNFPGFGIPQGAESRAAQSVQLAKEARKIIDPIMPVIDEVSRTIRPAGDEGAALENDARDCIQALDKKTPDDCDLLGLLEAIRDMHETGGDLDTVGSAVFYTHFLHSRARDQGRSIQVGRDYRYVFINYHQGLRHLEKFAPADVLCADFPTGAIPDLEGDIRYLKEKGVFFERFEDHHPYDNEQKAVFKKLQDENQIGYVSLSGENKDEDSIEEDMPLKCGADMVFESCIKDTSAENDGARELRRAAHSEDFVTDRYDLGLDLTTLIKGGVCKVELVQLLHAGMHNGDFTEKLKARGWKQLSDEWNAFFDTFSDNLLDHAYMISIDRKSPAIEKGSDRKGNLKSIKPKLFVEIEEPPEFIEKPKIDADELTELIEELHEEHDIPKKKSPEPEPEPEKKDPIKLIMAMAQFSEPGEPKIPTGKAVGYFREKFPDSHYIFYCFGSSIMVARRLDQEDFSMDMSTLMPAIGGEGDGGHPGASVGRPDANDRYPNLLLGRVNRGCFKSFVDYMSFRLNQYGYTVRRVENKSKQKPSKYQSPWQLVFVTAAALLLGIILVLFHPYYKRANVRKSNADFYSQIKVGHQKTTVTPKKKEAIKKNKEGER